MSLTSQLPGPGTQVTAYCVVIVEVPCVEVSFCAMFTRNVIDREPDENDRICAIPPLPCDTCLACDGAGRLNCQACDGEGHVYNQFGEDEGLCPDPRCVAGRVPCDACVS